ncbi:MAG: chromosome segregation protein SMC [Opitutales bacterium]|nr:chromosome segregation protein SMC [Opitutales bacterium]
MHLKELRINGFKSFADATRLHFDPGVTAIVGPNGCGKSNIADAIRWVLGEQSAKALRGGKMQDVIFEGTDDRKPLPLCEVALTFTDCEKELGEGFNEIEICRRVSRDDGGEYLLNGKSCRLKDIQRIFMDTGIGRTSYSIMAQGQIDQILSTNPTERRAIFEEAAGITRYKAQRRETLNKLKLVEGNLTRLTDVIGEVQRQIGSLRRQASKAVRYKRLRYRLEKLDLAWSAFQFAGLCREVNELSTNAKRLQETGAGHRSRLAAAETQVEALREKRKTLSEHLQVAQQAVFDLRSEKEQAENRAGLAEARIGDLSFRLEETTNEISSLEKQLAELEETLRGSSQQKEKQDAVFRESDEVFRQKNAALLEARQKLDDYEQQIQVNRRAVLVAENEWTRERNRISSLEVDFKADEKRLEALAGDEKGLAEEVSSAEAEKQRTEAEVAGAKAEETRLTEKFRELREQVEGQRGEVREAEKTLQEQERENARLVSRLKTLEQLRERLEGFSEGAKALLQGKCGEAFSPQDMVPLTRGLKLKAGYGPFLEQLLGAALEMVAVDSPETAQAAVKALHEGQWGRACLQFPVPGRAPQEEVLRTGVAQAPDFLEPAIDFFTAKAKKSSVETLQPLLAGCYLADSLESFLPWWEKNPDFPFRLVVTREGDLVEARGLLFGGSRKSKNNTILQREAEIQESEQHLAEGQEKTKTLQEAGDGARKILAEAEKTLEHTRQELSTASQKRGSLEAAAKAAARALEEVERRRNKFSGEKDKLVARIEEARGKYEEACARVEKAKRNYEERKKEAHQHEEGMGNLREEVEKHRQAVEEERFALAEKRQRLEMLDRGLAEAGQRRERARLNLAQKQQDQGSFDKQKKDLQEQVRRQREKAGKFSSEMAEAQKRVEELREKSRVLEDELSTLDRDTQKLRKENEQSSNELHRIEVRLAQLASKKEHFVEECQREYEVELETVDWVLSLWEVEAEPPGKHPLDLEEEEDGPPAAARSPEALTDEERAKIEAQTEWSTVSEEVQKLRGRLQSMGPVNLVAIEEYAELKERHEFLQAQCNDLTESRDQLVRAIDEINERSQTQFQTIFAQIKKNFAYTFEKLFGGGKADLELLECEDPLESGVEIIAQPPGTRLKTLVLLSGGQKTMTAVSLLFAIYMVKPSPFCVLDELDAPLDEANIGRFTSMLREFTSKSQFLIITHNKRTISEAGAIFGVTMEEKGVSKVVSMRFSREKEEPEAVAG